MEDKLSPLISVIVPIYNVEKYLSRCIDSIINQTYSNIQIILINDGSTDNSVEICEKYQLKDNRIKFFSKNNGGLSDARNYGMRHADGDYYVFVDSDDCIHPQMVELLWIALSENNADIAVCDFEKINEAEAVVYEKYENSNISNSKKIYNRYSSVKELFSGEQYVRFTVAWNKLYKRELFGDLEYPVGKIHEDEYLAYRLLFKSNIVSYIGIPLYYYCQRSGSITGSKFSEKKFDKLYAYKERSYYFISEGMFEKEAIKYYISYYMYMLKEYTNAFPGNIERYNYYFDLLVKDYNKMRTNLGIVDRFVTRIEIYHPQTYKVLYRFDKRIKKIFR